MPSSPPSFTAKIKRIEDETVYQDTVYSQTATLELKEGQSIQVFDKDAKLEKGSQGEKKDFFLSLLEHDIVADVSEDIGFERSENPLGRWSYDVTGIVEQIKEMENEKSEIILTVGKTNKLRTNVPKNKIKNISSGDKIKFPNSRLDLEKVFESV